MAKKPTTADLNAKAQAALTDAKATTADAEAKLAAATEAKDEDAIAKATADLNAAKELEAEAQTAADAAAEAAASGQAPAAKVTAAAPEPEAPADAAPQSFMQHLQSEITAAEQTAQVDLHAWLLSLESHLGGLVAHCKRLEAEASPEIKKFVDGVKNLL